MTANPFEDFINSTPPITCHHWRWQQRRVTKRIPGLVVACPTCHEVEFIPDMVPEEDVQTVERVRTVYRDREIEPGWAVMLLALGVGLMLFGLGLVVGSGL